MPQDPRPETLTLHIPEPIKPPSHSVPRSRKLLTSQIVSTNTRSSRPGALSEMMPNRMFRGARFTPRTVSSRTWAVLRPGSKPLPHGVANILRHFFPHVVSSRAREALVHVRMAPDGHCMMRYSDVGMLDVFVQEVRPGSWHIEWRDAEQVLCHCVLGSVVAIFAEVVSSRSWFAVIEPGDCFDRDGLDWGLWEYPFVVEPVVIRSWIVFVVIYVRHGFEKLLLFHRSRWCSTGRTFGVEGKDKSAERLVQMSRRFEDL